MTGPIVTVVVPTYAHASTIDLALASIGAQTVAELDIVVIGDGASEEVRHVVGRCAAADDRIRAVWAPPSPASARGEHARHAVLKESVAPFACYVGDDDLLLPEHLAVMLELLADADFAHPLPMAIRPDGTGLAHCGDLALAESRDWHRLAGRNAVSLTGVTHRLAAYRRLPGWSPAPPGTWSDHHMWQQWLAEPGMRFASASVPTVVKVDSSLRMGMEPAVRRTELLGWAARLAEPGLTAELTALALEAHRVAAVRERVAAAAATDNAGAAEARWHQRVGDLEAALAAVSSDRDTRAVDAADAVTAEGLASARVRALEDEMTDRIARLHADIAVMAAGFDAERTRWVEDRTELLVSRQQAADEVLRTRDALAAAIAAAEAVRAELAQVTPTLAARLHRRLRAIARIIRRSPPVEWCSSSRVTP